QAEDGIRYYKVTGVQTCALPISPSRRAPSLPAFSLRSQHQALLRLLPTIGSSGARVGLFEGAERKLLPRGIDRRANGKRARGQQIGRASCRERGGSAGGASW